MVGLLEGADIAIIGHGQLSQATATAANGKQEGLIQFTDSPSDEFIILSKVSEFIVVG
jgi:hypothetical protein